MNRLNKARNIATFMMLLAVSMQCLNRTTTVDTICFFVFMGLAGAILYFIIP